MKRHLRKRLLRQNAALLQVGDHLMAENVRLNAEVQQLKADWEQKKSILEILEKTPTNHVVIGWIRRLLGR